MKKIIFKSFLLLWTVLLACSCNDLLDEKAYDFVSPEQLGDSESAASQLVTGAYNTVITSGKPTRFLGDRPHVAR